MRAVPLAHQFSDCPLCLNAGYSQSQSPGVVVCLTTFQWAPPLVRTLCDTSPVSGLASEVCVVYQECFSRHFPVCLSLQAT